ncbi:hypothetical protein KI387_006238 [Taxus chinensis]|uniref:HEAT repeat-containing protein n=1 Tax=Taxus chinensis TaxID=29808 RepID=A0AA38LKQ9_TAXCH|nr:hypothetical protein KI387_006238 [Taxus chinensis]
MRSAMVRKAAMDALQENAPFNSIAILDCCTAVFRGGRKRFGQGGSHIASIFQIMAFTVRVMNEREIDVALLTKLAKVATSEMTISKDLDTDWQRAASSLLVAIGTRLPDLMMVEVFLHLAGSAVAISAMVQTLAEFASAEASKFTPRLKDVLSRVLPVLGNIKDAQRPIFANAIKCWCQAVWQYRAEFPLAPEFDHDVLAFLHSAFDLLLRVWATSRELKVRLSAIDALGKMVGLINRAQLKAALPRLLPAVLGLYKRVENAYVVTCSLHSLLDASLMSDTGPPLLDFEDLIIVVNTLLPLTSTHNSYANRSELGWALKNYNEMLRCFLTIGSLYYDNLFSFLMSKINSKEDFLKLGALCVLKHLLPRLSEAWYERRLVLIEAVKSLLNEQDLSVRKSLAELIAVMASHCYVEGACGELFVEFLVQQCAIAEEEVTQYQNQQEAFEMAMGLRTFHATKTELKMGAVSPAELRTVSEKGLLLLTITIPEMEIILWPFLLKMIIPSKYTAAVATICRCISELARHRIAHGNPLLTELKSHTDLPTAECWSLCLLEEISRLLGSVFALQKPPCSTHCQFMPASFHEQDTSQGLPDVQEVDIEVISPEIEVLERILAESNDIENNVNVASDSKLLLGIGKSTLESDMVMAQDSMDILLKRLEKYKSQNSQLKAEKNQLVDYVQHLINSISSTFLVPDAVAAPDEETLNLSKEINTLGHVTKSWLSEILIFGGEMIKDSREAP